MLLRIVASCSMISNRPGNNIKREWLTIPCYEVNEAYCFFVCAKDPLQPLAWNIKLLIPITSTNEFKNIFHNRSLIKGVPTYFPEEWRQPQCEDFWVLSLQVIQRSPDHLRVITKSHPSQRVTFLFPTRNWFALNWYPIVIMSWGDHCYVISCPLIVVGEDN